MQKKIKLLIVMLIIGLTGCGNTEMENTEYSSESEITETIEETEFEKQTEFSWEINVAEEELTLMQKVLFNKTEFNDGKKIGQLEGIYDYDFKHTFFNVVDLDGDGNAEVCVNYPPGKVLILHENGGMVYGYLKNYREFNPVYKYGTFGASSGASESFFVGNVTFERNQFEYDIILAWKSDPNESKIYKDSYWGSENPIEITGEECEKILEKYTMEKVEDYEFTIENILKYVK